MATAFRKQHYQQSLSSLSAIFFDLDNTLVETRKADNQTCRKVQEKRTSNLKSLSPLPSFQSPPSRDSLSTFFSEQKNPAAAK